MLSFTDHQIDTLREGRFRLTLKSFVESLRRDFGAELADRTDEDLETTVHELVLQFRQLNFRQGQHLYRLVAWGVFLGSDFLETHGNGSALRIADGGGPEADRFQRIRALLTAEDGGTALRRAPPGAPPGAP